MATIFTQIIKGDIPSYRVAENDQFYAFLDIYPLSKGHTLVVPKREVDYVFDLDDDELAAMHIFAKRVAKAIEKVIPCKRVGVAVVGLEVPHAHIHLIPITKESDMILSNPKLKLSQEELAAIAKDISEAFKA
ncbi:HIT family protein [Bacteroides propionicifaciens]|jgi:histidine triad (HIT) family protein|uniref:HIT family protein n=1 Tax=Bacteroides propionicifaciens TaxID=392838 RepID=UPI00036742F4|nr:HIT family protein [Bacteroides propionicifaciens]